MTQEMLDNNGMHSADGSDIYAGAALRNTKMFKCRKGDVYYVLNSYASESGDPKPGRPAVVISNDHLGATSDAVLMAYMTTQAKRPMPEHVTVYSGDPKVQQSTVLCEKIGCVPKNRLGQFMRHMSDEELERIDSALMFAFGIRKRDIGAGSEEAKTDGGADAEAEENVRKELEFYKRMCDYLTSKLKGGAEAVV